MCKKITLLAISIACTLVLSGCGTKTGSQGASNVDTGSQNKGTGSGTVTDRTDYVIFYKESSPPVMGGMVTHQYIVGRPVVEAGTIKYNAYLVPWKISFSQVQRVSLSILSAACKNLTEQVLYIEGWIDLDLSELGLEAKNLPSYDPVSLKGTIHETVKGTPGTWQCASEIITKSTNAGSIKYVQDKSGNHVANFPGASNMTSLTISGADLYLDFSYQDDIQFIWPAGTKIEYAPEGTPIPLEPLSPAAL
ncbi:MAG: hypothetical protein COT26_00415 [Candidatus Kerfeldbacteria bacterium CG08_land_8_20_14_0_20_43_14]|uniref:Lipoprotein n=1 Tax=Candidatus Kerfeldbacteria bacterium CG08_land_8_20_14_0_20_43_14 TaxID=2014246 RepID=A0A2H0YR59_9BACT|nr:MAG: hypothetical protein COT26_00415 [Candidatus Kerfeldbacteria bacterium CG08_land_8_20_14_0_20_43_14]